MKKNDLIRAFIVIVVFLAVVGLIFSVSAVKNKNDNGANDTNIDTSDTTASDETEETKCVHKWGSAVVETPATCAKEGLTSYTCLLCEFVKFEDIPKLTEHEWNNGEITKAATCAVEGIKTFTCTVCNKTKAETIVKLTTHTEGEGEITSVVGCLSDGVKSYYCLVCNKLLKTEVYAEALGHDYSGDVTAVGEYIYVDNDIHSSKTQTACNRCENIQYSYEDEPCDYGETTTSTLQDSSTQHKIVASKTCKWCEHVNTTTTYVEHNFGSSSYAYVSLGTASHRCTETKTCTVCGYVYTKESTLSHVYNEETGKCVCSAECSHATVELKEDEADGNGCVTSIPYRCIVCNKITKYETTTDHSNSDYSESGDIENCRSYSFKICNGCGAYYDKVYGDWVHVWNDGEIKTEPECESDGLTVYTCVDCGATEERVVEAIGHNYVFYDDQYVLYNSEADHRRYLEEQCSNCSDIVYQESYEPHEFVVNDATDWYYSISEDSSMHWVTKTYTCASQPCGYSKTETTTEGHSYGDSGECTLCSYVPPCTHPTEYVSVDDSKTTYSSSSDLSHNIDLTYVCGRCGEVAYTDQTVSLHVYEGDNTCDYCDYVCSHTSSSTAERKEDCKVYTDYTCDYCELLYKSVYARDEHEYDYSNGELMEQYSSNDNGTHKIRMKFKCVNCYTYDYNWDNTDDCTFVDGICKYCDYECPHSFESDERYCIECGEAENPDWECPNALSHVTGGKNYTVTSCEIVNNTYVWTIEYFCDWCDWRQVETEYPGNCANLSSCNGHSLVCSHLNYTITGTYDCYQTIECDDCEATGSKIIQHQAWNGINCDACGFSKESGIQWN